MCPPETKTDNTGAVIGGVVAVAVALIAAVTVIVIVVLRSRSSTPKTRLVCPAKHYIPLNKAWYVYQHQ